MGGGGHPGGSSSATSLECTAAPGSTGQPGPQPGSRGLRAEGLPAAGRRRRRGRGAGASGSREPLRLPVKTGPSGRQVPGAPPCPLGTSSVLCAFNDWLCRGLNRSSDSCRYSQWPVSLWQRPHGQLPGAPTAGRDQPPTRGSGASVAPVANGASSDLGRLLRPRASSSRAAPGAGLRASRAKSEHGVAARLARVWGSSARLARPAPVCEAPVKASPTEN